MTRSQRFVPNINNYNYIQAATIIMKKIAFVCFDNFQILDLTDPMQVFDSALLAGEKYYDVHTFSNTAGQVK